MGRAMIEPVVHKAQSFAEAEVWDILQNIRMTPEERRRVARELKRRAYGDNCPDVRDAARR
jgi:hypothetical protein